MLVQEGYTFSYNDELGTVEVQYPDSTRLNFLKIKPVCIGCMPEDTPEGNIYVVAIITKASILKLGKGITSDLEVLGFRFKSRSSSLLVQNFLCANLFQEQGNDINTNEKSKENIDADTVYSSQ